MILYYIFAIVFCNYHVWSSLTFNFEKQNMYAPRRPIMFKNINWKEYPEPLPSSSTVKYMKSPYHNLYQGVRRNTDRRVYNKRFVYAAKPTGHRLFCQGMFDCVISHLSVETNESIPIILRGGAGYNFFSVVIRARPYDELSGLVRAYCPQPIDEKWA